MAVQKLRVPELTREAEAGVEQRLRRIDGVLFAVANYRDECVEVEFDDDTVGVDTLIATLGELGFGCRLAG